jgi:hypothetical protein
MGRTKQLPKKVSYGKPQDARLDWNIRQVTKAVFKDPLDVVGQNVENIIDEHLIRKRIPTICNVYCSSKELIIEDFIGMTAADIEENYIVFGVSGKSRVFGRYGHGGKDTALAVAKYFHIVSRFRGSTCAYKIWEDKNLKVRYAPAWGLPYEKQKEKDGTLIIIPNSGERFTLKEVEEYLTKNFYLGLVEETIIIGLGKKYGTRQKILKTTLPSDSKKKPVNIKFRRKDVKQYCDKPPLKHSPEVKGFYLLLKEGELLESGYNIFAHGKFITAIPSSTKVVAYLGMDFLLETDQLSAAKELKIGKRSFFQRYLQPKLAEWEKENLGKLKEEETDKEFLDEVESLLGPLWGSKKRQVRKRRPRQRKSPIEFQKRRTPPNPGKTPGHGRLNLIEDKNQPLVVGIHLPDSIFINKGNPDGEFIWQLSRQTKKTLLYSRAAIFLPLIKQSKSGSITSTELNRVHEEALKSQEFWINAIRRDHGDKKTVMYKGKKRVVVG